jgi:uncharacterized membrane protein
MFLVPFLLVIFFILAFAYVLCIPGANSNPPNYENHHINVTYTKPLDILNERYAKGEITEEEYFKVKRNLEH